MDKNINALDTSENLPGESHSLSISEYLKVVLDERVEDNDVESFAEYQKNPDAFLTSLKVRMKEVRKSYGSSTVGIKDADIDDVAQKDIARIMAKKMQHLVDSRNRAFYLIKTYYPKIRENNDWETALRKHINEQDVDSLTGLIKNIRSKSKVQKFFFGSDLVLSGDALDTVYSEKFSKVFHDIDTIRFATPEFKKFVENLLAKHDKYGTVPKSSELRKVLEAYKDVPAQRKKEILIALGATVTLGMAEQYNLVSDDIIDNYLRTSFGQLFEGLSNEEKKIFRNEILNLHSDIIHIDAVDLDTAELDDFFQNKQSLKKVVDNILENRLSIDLGVTENLGNILSKAAQRFPDEEDHQMLFNRYVDLTVKNEKGENIPGILNLSAGSIVEFETGKGKQYFEIIKTHDDKQMPLDLDNGFSSGVIVRELPSEGGVLKNGAEEGIAYDTLYGFFNNFRTTVNVLSALEFQNRLSHNRDEEGKLFDARVLLEGDEITKENIALRLDTVDPTGREYGFEVGTYFSSPEASGEEGFGDLRIWKVVSVDSGGAEVLSEQGTVREYIPYDVIYALAENKRLSRKYKIIDDESLVASLKMEGYGSLRSTATLKDGLLSQKNKDASGKEIDETIRVFAADKGAHIRINGISGGFVNFGEYAAEDDDFKISNYAKKHGSKSAFNKFYNSKTLTYGAFVDYINKNKLKASNNDIIDDHVDHHHDHDHSHAHGSLLSRIGKMQTLSSMWKGVELVWHSLEHTLEKGAKLDAARFAMKLSKFIPMDSVEAQIYADIVDGSKETVEKYKNKIGNLPGPKGRWKCIHIAHNLDARPEEVMAAIQFMVSGYGHLYAEDTKHYQSVVNKSNIVSKPMGYYSYLDAFIHSTNLPGSLIEWRQKAYEKAKPEVEDEGEPPEEQLLHALFKSIDGNPEKYPYAASVVKAIGGPGGFERDWKFDGTKNAMQKGRDQTTMVNSQGRLNKAVGYLTTHEFYKAIGAMEKVAGKVKAPKFQALPFIWAVGGYSKFASPTSLQEIKNYAEMGFSFHAYSFMRRESDNMIYRDTVRLALAELSSQGRVPSSAISEFNAICERMDHGPEDTKITDDKYKKLAPPRAMMLFWQNYAEKGLHDMLQGHDGWITKMSKENSTIEKYRLQLADGHGSQLKNANVPTSENGNEWYEEHGLGMNGIFRSTDKDGFMSIYSNLNKIKFTGTNRGGKPMDANNKEKIWDYQVKRIMDNRNVDKFYGDKAMQKKQYMIWRSEIINYFAEQLSAATVRNDMAQIEESIRQYPYFRDLEGMGIDPKAIFLSELVEQNAEADYKAWLLGGRNAGIQSAGIVSQIRGKGTKVFDHHSGLSHQDSDSRLVSGTTLGNTGVDLQDSD